MNSRSPSADSVLHDAMATTRDHAHTFALATRLLPRDLRDDVYLLYLVCRTLDDLVDEHHADAGTRLSQVRRWAEGQPAAGREERILDGLFQRHPLMPREAIADFCEGQMVDLNPRPFEDELQLDRYAYQVAGTVGRLMVAMLGPTSPNADASGRALGIAMQRTNILRDLDEDLANHRVYLPRQTMRLARVHDLRTDDRRRLVRIEIAIAEDWYEQGIEVVHQVRRGQLAVQAAALMYREILRQIERQHFDGRRAVVRGWRKAALLAEALLHD